MSFSMFYRVRERGNRTGPRHLARGKAVYHTECSILLLGMDGLEAGLGDLMEFLLIEGICHRGSPLGVIVRPDYLLADLLGVMRPLHCRSLNAFECNTSSSTFQVWLQSMARHKAGVTSALPCSRAREQQRQRQQAQA